MMLTRSSKRKRIATSNPCSGQAKVKRSRRETVSESLKAIGLNGDCLEHIFRYLNLTDLTNVAEAHPQFVSSARLVFKQKYAKNTVYVKDSGIGLSMHNKRIFTTLTIFMKNFGDLIQELSLDYSFTAYQKYHYWRETEQAIFKNCSKTLKSIEMKYCRANVMEEIRKSFEKVGKLTITSGTIDQNSIQLSKWFPNIQYLVLDSVNIRDPAGIKDRFRALDNVQLRKLRSINQTLETLVRSFLQSHRQIEKLYIDFNYETISPDFLMFLSTALENLTILSLHRVDLSSAAMLQNIHFKWLKDFVLENKILHEINSTISISFDQLNSMELYWIHTNDVMWRNFIVQNSNLTRLVFCPSVNSEEICADDLLEIVEKLPNLNELEIRARSTSRHAVTQFMKWWHPSLKLQRLLLRVCSQNRLREYENVIDSNLEHKFQKSTVQIGDITKMILNRKIS